MSKQENLKKYQLTVDTDQMQNDIEHYRKLAREGNLTKKYADILHMVDLTTLTETDNEAKIAHMCQKVNGFHQEFVDLQNVAAICVYPAMVPYVKKYLKVPEVNIASVGGGFPASQTFTAIKAEECKAAAEAGANEIDIVIPVGEFIAGNEQLVFEEIKAIKVAIGSVHLKVILETGDLDPNQIRIASLLAMEAGADFIKTSTGKVAVSATHEAMYIMCHAIKDYVALTDRKVGIKPAGGIREADDALVYYAIVENILGEEWLNNSYFRYGASSLANNVLKEIKSNPDLKYF